MNACLLVCAWSALYALPLAFLARSSRPPRRVRDFAVSPRDQVPKGGAGLNLGVFKSAFLPCHRVKMDIPKPRGILPLHGSDFRSRAPLSIGALHSIRNERIRQETIFVRKPIVDFPVRAALSRAWSRMTGGGNSLKLYFSS